MDTYELGQFCVDGVKAGRFVIGHNMEDVRRNVAPAGRRDRRLPIARSTLWRLTRCRTSPLSPRGRRRRRTLALIWSANSGGTNSTTASSSPRRPDDAFAQLSRARRRRRAGCHRASRASGWTASPATSCSLAHASCTRGAKRGLLVDFGAWGDPPTAAAIRHAMAVGDIDYYVLKPWRDHDELFHRTISEFLYEWSRSESSETREIVLVAPPFTPRGYELRNLLVRNGLPHVFAPSDSARRPTSSCARSGETARPNRSSFCTTGASSSTRRTPELAPRVRREHGTRTAPRLRRRDRRRRAGGTAGGGVRRRRRTRRARDRTRGDRRAGGNELAHPQLPRLRTRRQRRRARSARLPAGMGVRRRVLAHEGGHRSRDRRRPSHGDDRRRHPGVRSRRRACFRRHVPAARCSRDRGARRFRRVLRVVGRRSARMRRQARVRGGWRQLGRASRARTSPATRHASRFSSADRRWPRRCRSTCATRSTPRRTSTSATAPKSPAVVAAPVSTTS